MSAINITNIVVNNNPARFLDPFSFDITFECLTPLEDDIEFKLIYIGCASDEKYDQVLDTVVLGPLQYGTMKFTFEANSPTVDLIPPDEILGITAALVTCSFREQEFFRVGYYVSNMYTDPQLIENPPTNVQLELLQRSILAENPRITRFAIDWEQRNQFGNFPANGVTSSNDENNNFLNQTTAQQDRQELASDISKLNQITNTGVTF